MQESNKNKIIIVEDNLLIATEIQKRLEKTDYVVLGIFESGEELIGKIDKLYPDLILMDIMLKGNLSGIETTKIILQSLEVPVIYLTAYSDRDTFKKAKETGPFAFLVKPVTKEELLITIEMAIYNHRAKHVNTTETIIAKSLHSLEDAIITCKPDGSVQFLNSTAEKLLEINFSNKINFSIDEILFSKLELVNASDFMYKDKLARLQKKFTHDIILKIGIGRTVEAVLKISPIFNVNDEINGIVYIVKLKDETENLKLLKDSEERFRSVIENIQLAAIMLDKAGQLLFCNEYFHSITGWNKEEALGKNWFENFVPGNDINKKKLAYLEALQIEGIPQVNSEWIKCKNGSSRFIKWNNIPIRDKKNKIIGYTSIGEDITEKFTTENELKKHQTHLESLVEERTMSLHKLNNQLQEEIRKQKEAEEQNIYHINFLSTLIDAAPSPIFIKDVNKKYINCNKSFEDYFGLKKPDVIGNTEDFLLPSELAQRVNVIEDELLKTGGQKIYEGKITNQKGEEKEFIVTKATFNKTDNSIGGVIAITVDVTDLKKLERDLAAALKKEKELNELKSRFISTTSHEFRTPLTSIITSADLLEMFGQKWDEKEYKNHINKIQKAVAKMTELLEDVLAVNKAESEKTSYNPARESLPSFISEIIEEMLRIDDSRHPIYLNYDTDHVDIIYDKKIMQTILVNLLSNAIKYSPADKEIDVIVESDDKFLYIKIRDYGIGIPPEDQAHIFEPFHRAKNIGNVSGTGLGLSIVKKAVDLHKGDLFFSSELDYGSEFTIKISLENETNK